MGLSRKGLGSLSLFSVGVGVVIGIVISHVFKSTIDGVWAKVPLLNQVGSNYAYRQY